MGGFMSGLPLGGIFGNPGGNSGGGSGDSTTGAGIGSGGKKTTNTSWAAAENNFSAGSLINLGRSDTAFILLLLAGSLAFFLWKRSK